MNKKTTGQQFFHIETYAKKQSRNKGRASQKRAGRQSNKNLARQANKEKSDRLRSKISRQSVVSGILNEAGRQEGYCHHVEQPLKPEVLYGDDLPTLEMKVNHIYDNYKNIVVQKSGKIASRKIRQDQHVLLAGVASHPRASSDYFSDDDTREMVDLWLDDTVAFLKEEFGGSLKSVILHLDEKHPHVHFYCLPECTYKKVGEVNVPVINPLSSIHKGIEAREKAEVEADAMGLKGTPKVKHIQNAFGSAMSEMQDSFHEVVSMEHGHERLGPKRKRFQSRKEYQDYLKDQEAFENESHKKLLVKKEKEKKDEELGSRIRKKEEKIADFENVIFPKLKEKAKKSIIEAKKREHVRLKKQLTEIEKNEKRRIKERYLIDMEYVEEKVKGEELELREVMESKLKKLEQSKKIELKDKYEYEATRIMNGIDEVLDHLSENGDVDRDLLGKLCDIQDEYVVKLNRNNREKGLQINELKEGNEALKSELKTLKNKFEKLKNVYDSLVDKFEHLYNFGIDSYKSIFGKVKNRLRKSNEIENLRF